jgi:GAF domain-containing protein
MASDDRERLQDQVHQVDLESGVGSRPREQLLTKLIIGQTIAVTFLATMTTLAGLLTAQSDLFSLLPLAAIAALVGLASLWLSRNQRSRQASYVFLFGTTIAITTNVALRGYQDASAIYYLWPIVGAAVLLETKGEIWVALFSTISYLALLAAQELGYQVPSFPYDPQKQAFLTVGSRVMLFFLLAFLASLSSRSLGRALHQAQETAHRWRELNETLEQRIARRTEELAERAAELEESNRQNQQRTTQLETSAQVAHAVASVLDVDRLLDRVVRLISDHFGHYHTGVFLLDETGRWAVLRATNSEGGQHMLVRNHRLRVGAQGIVGNVARTGQPYVAHNVGADAVHFDNPDLPDTRTEIALPLIARDRIIGALDIQSTEESAFDEADVAVFSALANQIAIALDNARLYEAGQAALEQVQAVQRQYAREAWGQFTAQHATDLYMYQQADLAPVGDAGPPEIDEALSKGTTTTTTGENGQAASIIAPIKVRGEIIGALGLQEAYEEMGHVWSDEDIALIETVADQVGQALEAARLYKEAQRRAQREQLVTDITGKIRSAPDIEGILRVAVQEIRRALGVSHGVIRLGTETHLRPPAESAFETEVLESEGGSPE